MNFELKLEEVNMILTGLGKLPLEHSLFLWSKLKSEAELQLANKSVDVKESE